MAELRSPGRVRLAFGMAILAAANNLTTGVLIALPPAGRVAEVASIRLGEGLAFAVTWTAFAIVGVLIVRHQPHNTVGWLCIITGFQVSVVALFVGIATFTLAADPHSPVGMACAWISHTASALIIAAPLLIFFRFPTGRSLGGWWRRAEGLVILSVGLFMLLAAFEPMPLSGFPTTPNPLAVGDTRRIGLAFGPVLVSTVLAVASLVVRFRQGSSLERRQLRLLAGASILVGGAIVTMPLTSPDLVSGGHLSTVTSIINAVAFVMIPVAIWIAITREHLYDIDRLVNRTLVYAGVSGILVGVYGASVLALTPVLGAVTPGAGNTLVTAGSTLLAAGLFRPVRARAQAVVDRRFDRERFEAARMIESFSSQVRSEVELDGVVGHLLGAAGRTVHPSVTGCWIRPLTVAPPALVASADNP